MVYTTERRWIIERILMIYSIHLPQWLPFSFICDKSFSLGSLKGRWLFVQRRNFDEWITSISPFSPNCVCDCVRECVCVCVRAREDAVPSIYRLGISNYLLGGNFVKKNKTKKRESKTLEPIKSITGWSLKVTSFCFRPSLPVFFLHLGKYSF